MKKKSHRVERLSEQIRRDLAQIILKELRDPRLMWVSLTHVHLTPDYAHAKVFFSVLNEKDAWAIGDSLNKSAAFLRNVLGKNWQAHTLPHLQFVYDESLLAGQQMENLIKEALSKTAEDENPR